MEKDRFKDIKNLKHLSGFLCTDEDSIRKFLSQKDTINDTQTKDVQPESEDGIVILKLFEDSPFRFNKMHIPKRNDNSKFRIVYKVTDEHLKNIHKIIHKKINEIYKPLDCVHGFVYKRNVATNAKVHLRKKIILKLDIENFFPSVKKEDIVKCFLKMDCNSEIAEILTTLVTINGELVQGFNTSPIIANLILQEMDKSLLLLSKSYNSNYSRYADDLYFSTDQALPSFEEIIEIVSKNGFSINKDKTRYMRSGHKQYVTGLTVFDDKFPRIPKRFKNRIRFSLHYLMKYGPNSISENTKPDNYLIYNENLIKGWIDYVNAIEPGLAKKFYDQFNRIKWQ